MESSWAADSNSICCWSRFRPKCATPDGPCGRSTARCNPIEIRLRFCSELGSRTSSAAAQQAHRLGYGSRFASLAAVSGVLRNAVALAGREKQIRFQAMLARVEIPVAAMLLEERFMRPALDNPATLNHQDLIGAADGRKPVSDHKRRAALHQVAQAFLNQRLGFRV